jgi:prolyl oligopeptidase
MKLRLLIVTITLATICSCAKPTESTRLVYPEARKIDQVDDFFGTKVPDPYRWLENADSQETRAWIDAENNVTFAYLNAIPERARIKRRLTDIWNYERYGTPLHKGPYYIFSRNTGLQRQAILYKAKAIEAEPEVLLDPNTLSADGTVALRGLSLTDDGRYAAYSIAESGSDWVEWRVRDVATSKDLSDRIRWSKFSGAAWLKDGSGFFYCRYEEPVSGTALQAVNKNQKVYFHKIGKAQETDTLVYARSDKPDWLFEAEVSDDGRYLLISQTESSENRNRVFVKDLGDNSGKVRPFLDGFDASYTIVGNDDDLFYVLTNRTAPRNRLVAIKFGNPKPEAWTPLIAESPGKVVLEDVRMAKNRFVAHWLMDARSSLRIHDLNGKPVGEIALPGIGSVGAFSCERKDTEAFYSFSSYLYATTIFRYDFVKRTSRVFKRPSVSFDAARYETVQAFYPSKDGTRIAMFITYRKGLVRNGQNPTLLYGYGGFNVPVRPEFSPEAAGWLEMGGIYAVAILRGGGEYGQKWYDAGRLKNKQNVFDDFIAGAEYLIRERYTSSPKLAIHGRSNGGLLVGACITQHPELFGAAIPAVGVMDVLRFHQFTIGWAWKSDYGDPEKKEDFDAAIRYSPLHNIRTGTRYPATLVTTADHDDRVAPLHSFKFAAALQAAQAGGAPVLIRIETKAGHGGGKPTDKLIEERADMYGFLLRCLGMTLPPDFGGAL